MKSHRKSRTRLKNAPRQPDQLTLRDLPFAELVQSHLGLIEARRYYADKSPYDRRAAADWEYHDAIATGLLLEAVDHGGHGNPSKPRLDAGVAALAIDPLFAPALLTVGSIEYQLGRVDAAMALFLALPALPADEPDLVEIIEKAGDFLLDQDDFSGWERSKIMLLTIMHHSIIPA